MLRLNPPELYFLGAASIGYGLWGFLAKKQRLKTWIPVMGVVDNIRRDRNGNVSVVVKYVTKDGGKQLCTLPIANGDTVGLGSELTVAYNPIKPAESFIADKRDMNFAVIAAVVIGAALWIAATFALFADGVFPEQLS